MTDQPATDRAESAPHQRRDVWLDPYDGRREIRLRSETQARWIADPQGHPWTVLPPSRYFERTRFAGPMRPQSAGRELCEAG